MNHVTKKWCALCYHNNKNTIGICDGINAIHQHYEECHKSMRNQWPRSDALKAFNVKFKDSKPYLFDDVPSRLPHSSAFEGAPLYLRHKKTEQNIVDRIERNTQYAIAFYKKPLRSAHNNYEWSMHTLWSAERDGLFVVRICELIPVYPLLKQQLLNEYPEVMDDVLCRQPSNLKQLAFKHKALQIIREIKRCATWIRPFLKPVNEIEDFAPNYYKIITNPMDLGSLKSLIENKTIQTPKDFCAKLTSIWCNAQKFNPKEHKVHQCAIKCMAEAERLVNKYFPELCRESVSSPYAIVNYENHKRRSLSCPVCSDSTLAFLVGFYTDCACDVFHVYPPKKCNECQCVLNDTSIAYYHCVKGCKSNHHSIFLCEKCAAEDYDSVQIDSLPFNGLWISLGISEQNDFFYEAIVCRQEANRVFFRLVYSNSVDMSDDFGETYSATVSSREPEKIAFQVDEPVVISNTVGQLNSTHSQLKFINPNDKNDVNAYDKEVLKCEKSGCHSTLLFMQKKTIPTYDGNGALPYCDVHSQYYGNKHMQCISRDAFAYDDKPISEVAFYYTCVECKDFDICAGCVLVKREQEWKHNNHQLKFQSGETKKRKRSYSIETDSKQQQKRRRIKSKTVAKKQKISSTVKMDAENKEEDAEKYSYKELLSLYLKEKEKNHRLSERNHAISLELEEAKCKFDKLYSKVKQVFLNDQKGAPPPI